MKKFKGYLLTNVGECQICNVNILDEAAKKITKNT